MERLVRSRFSTLQEELGIIRILIVTPRSFSLREAEMSDTDAVCPYAEERSSA